jgi:carboxyl-terminal processing protease
LKDFFEKHKSALEGAAVGVLVTVVLVTALCGGFSGLRAAARFVSVLRVVQTQYVGEYDLNALTEDAMSAVISGLDDRWSYYMDEDTYEAYQDYSANQYQGIGVTITKDEDTGGFLVVSITKDGPAQTAGMEAGDIILAIDGVSVTEEDTSYVRELIQADYNKTALVTVLRADGQTVDFSVSCEVIYTSPVSYELLEGDVGYVSIANFRQGAGAGAIAAIEDLMAQGAQCLVLDVRSNPGGQVTELVELLDYLLPEGDIFIRANKRGHEVVETSDAACVELPMAVLVNGDSYSAAEFFAAALGEYDWATVVGEPTTGKARSQVTIPLWDGGAVHLSKYTYLTPQRQDLYEAGGIVPDVEIVLTEQERSELDTGWLEPADDPQIQAAIAALNA